MRNGTVSAMMTSPFDGLYDASSAIPPRPTLARLRCAGSPPFPPPARMARYPPFLHLASLAKRKLIRAGGKGACRPPAASSPALGGLGSAQLAPASPLAVRRCARPGALRPYRLSRGIAPLGGPRRPVARSPLRGGRSKPLRGSAAPKVGAARATPAVGLGFGSSPSSAPPGGARAPAGLRHPRSGDEFRKIHPCARILKEPIRQQKLSRRPNAAVCPKRNGPKKQPRGNGHLWPFPLRSFWAGNRPRVKGKPPAAGAPRPLTRFRTVPQCEKK